ncbi:MAG: CBS domain-containing protein [Mesorhizobium sp.]|uniref:CBS domain-containing protein n=1 Tax=unclassified Mesorhizobium TaxID=325217 RepID=UPI000FCB3A36|nr:MULTISPECIES: CBS domain-containing protein [unclassified Mesorhizobium]RUV73384.1 CBS domain-containing protein [Mesorhizobium sp. M5C.F.Cr.IN.023.01.1.1]RWF87283.1 MAG: CBS domain-containing protein [Mesorhizobium sp.]RWF92383.1 MAG: CBS domain-containing protein [Mesorhizobium sp.]RWI43381.1 MAG: CBS domain-containing protein [Mesorhizobium sp.]RWI47711.1 MAG: CBS domain-containing protein [Mesorhizobium sp.]
MFVEKLRTLTSSRLAVVARDATVHDAALSLSKPGIGLVVVCDATGGLDGVLSKSDLIRHLSSPAPSPPPASALMSRPVITCGPKDDVHDVWQTMAARNLQNVPVIGDAAQPLGILDIRDAMKTLFEEEELQERMLFNYITGIGYR